MSAYSDWRCGAISDDEYRMAYVFERGEDHGEVPFYSEHEDDVDEDELEAMDLEDQFEFLMKGV